MAYAPSEQTDKSGGPWSMAYAPSEQTDKSGGPWSMAYAPSEQTDKSGGPWSMAYAPSEQTDKSGGPWSMAYAHSEQTDKSGGPWSMAYAPSKQTDSALWCSIVFHDGSIRTFETRAWLLVCSAQCRAQDKAAFVADSDVQGLSHKERLFGCEQRTVCRWEDVVDTTYCLHLNGHRPVVSAVDSEAVDRLRERPGNWALTHDEELAQFLCGEIFSQSDVAGNLGCIRDYVESIAVSSYSEDDRGAESLTDNDPDTFWESDGSQSNHWIRLQMKSETIIKWVLVQCDNDLSV
ncbi:E3 ubiquitin-protein ligase HECTD3 [Lamellibrachia satsuma]|nr:E3 ubiquitin-protein ligase HECTD3 [Lamellibrachia satsuma]